MASVPSTKRKQLSTSATPNPHRAAKSVKTSSARTILAQASDKALNQNGDLDVSAFVKAREFEIKALEASMGASKKTLATRAFQQLPKELRRRTASHNVKRVPKRLRPRAAKEMRDDNTPTTTARRRKPTPHMRLRLETAKKLQKLGALAKAKRAQSKKEKPGETDPANMILMVPRPPRVKKDTLAKPATPASKFRKRQVHKSWLPTHLFHAKRAHVTPPNEPLWRFVIPLTPAEKCYRATHRAGSSRGCVAWDTSYMSTIGLEGVQDSLLGLLRGVGVEETMLFGIREGKWRRGTRGWEGWIQERDGNRRSIAKAVVVWCAGSPIPLETGGKAAPGAKKARRRLFIRVHPSAFLQIWNEVLKVSKIQRPPVTVEDLRFEIGSIEITGPESTETLIAALQPTAATDNVDMPETIWKMLGAVTNPSALPPHALFGFDVRDPRLQYPPRTLKQLSCASDDELLQILSTWPPDTTQKAPKIFDRAARFEASRLLASQKAINRRKGAALPGEYPDPVEKDPHIPVLLLASRSSSTSSQGSWTVLLPWKCILPLWYSIMHYPLSSGGNPRFGGLKEKRQIAFEQGIAWFPGDYPGTKAGSDWEFREREKRKAEWEKRPKGKRTQWESVDLGDGRKGEIGNGWACDWERLFKGPPPSIPIDVSISNPGAEASASIPPPPKPAPATAPKAPDDPQILPTSPPPTFHHIPLPPSSLTIAPTSEALSTIYVSLLHRGSPTCCARIYRLPTTNPSLHAKWLAHASPHKSSSKIATHNQNPTTLKPPKSTPQHIQSQRLAASLLLPPPPQLSAPNPDQTVLRAGSAEYPPVPDEIDLIGFVTTGNFNLSEGRASAVGCIALARVLRVEGTKDGKQVKSNSTREDRLCIVRESGTGLGRLGRWEFI